MASVASVATQQLIDHCSHSIIVVQPRSNQLGNRAGSNLYFDGTQVYMVVACDPAITSYTSNLSHSIYTTPRQSVNSSSYFTISGESPEERLAYTITERFRFVSNCMELCIQYNTYNMIICMQL